MEGAEAGSLDDDLREDEEGVLGGPPLFSACPTLLRQHRHMCLSQLCAWLPVPLQGSDYRAHPTDSEVKVQGGGGVKFPQIGSARTKVPSQASLST